MQLEWVPSPIIDAALTVLTDGVARTADEILSACVARGLVSKTETRKHVYTSLSQYIERAIGSGRKPEITMDAEHRFRINRIPDDWPNVDTTGLVPLGTKPQLSPAANTAITRARKAAAGTDPAEYEAAVCDLFSNWGYQALHVGGTGAPDGYADALLGPLVYRVMIECKLAEPGAIAHSDAPVEASKFRNDYKGDYCILVAPAFAAESSFVAELQTHQVSAWTTDELISLVENGIGALQARCLFSKPGVAADALEDFEWERIHGAEKRLRVLASMVLTQAAAQQRMTLRAVDSTQAPHFTLDVALALVDTQLSTGSATGLCSRDEMQAVFEWLTNPLVHRAVWVDETKTAIVLDITG